VAIRTRPTTDLHELEALWDLPVRRPPRDREFADRLSRRISRVLAWTWPALLVALAVFEPAPAPNVQIPVWAEVVGDVFLLALLAGIIARFAAAGPRPALGFFAATGGMGMALGIACRTSGHHTGSWWAVETAVFSALTLAAVAGLAFAQRARR
jgi:hypothetical protein